MKPNLEPGFEYQFQFSIPETKTVPALYPEAPELQEMPQVFATGFLVGLLEWACIKALKPYLYWPQQQTVGTHINVSHCAATPPGLKVTAKVKLTQMEGRRLVFEVEAHDGIDVISKGAHERFIIDRARFSEKVGRKRRSAAIG
jgi:fluoroacetyl-CoA thioesterase